ncbi:HupE/UreJ family protein [Jannaschia sp. W003]|uniref:HupE/UreJ family protein n=1 Tax=Jannaschia sp. W003 TaxID=2867012 RepID=UPI0021A753B6|nr:HupE/UreJ family protein [Jannaschia sp. W003]UWQ22547.1 HupE/UreJ family protein [Jannaschia sp. W003]
MNRTLLAALASLAATPALAHHPLGGLPMETFAHGMLSGAGHPLLGFDHLAFVVAMGVAATFTARRILAPLAYVAAMVLGTLAVSMGAALPLAEAGIVLSLLVVGGIVLSGRALGAGAAMALFAGFGLFHGAGFAGSILGQEGGVGAAVMVGYLGGLAAVQLAVALAAGWAVRALLGATSAASVNARLAGAAVFGVGAFLALELAEGPLVAALAG